MQTFDPTDIDFNALVRFAFGEMNAEDEQAMELLLDENPYLAEAVDGILRFALDRGLKTREAFEPVWKAEMKLAESSVLQGKTKKKADPSEATGRWKWYVLAGLAIALIGAGIWVLKLSDPQAGSRQKRDNQQQDSVRLAPFPSLGKEDVPSITPPDPSRRSEDPQTKKAVSPMPAIPSTWQPDSSEQAALLQYFWDFEQDKLRVAGGSEQSWGRPFREQDYPEALEILEARIQNGTASIREYYMAGVLSCLMHQPDDAVRWLRKAEGNITRPALSMYLALAFAQKGERQATREQLAKTPAILLKEQPESLQAWLRSK